MMKHSLAVVTMAFNEKRNIQRWLNHYRRQTESYEHLYVVDHGSTDESTSGLPCHTINLPREAGGDRYQAWRIDYIASMCADLLNTYSAVLYVDCDELVVADPARWNSLKEYIDQGGKCNTTIGYDVLHNFPEEPSLNNGPVLSQRERLLFVGAMCKPTLIREPTKFAPGFHCSDHEPIFGEIYRFHLRYADMMAGLERLSITRTIDRPEMRNVPLDHHKIDDLTYLQWVKSWVSYPLYEDEIGTENPDFQEFIRGFDMRASNNGLKTFNYGYRGKKLYRVPKNFMYSA